MNDYLIAGYEQYRELAAKEKNVILSGRLGEYKYADMWKIIKDVRECADKEK